MPTAADAPAPELDAAAGADAKPTAAPAGKVDTTAVDAALDQAIRSAEELAAETEAAASAGSPEFLDIEKMLAAADSQDTAAKSLPPDAPQPDLNSIDDALVAIADEQVESDDPVVEGVELDDAEPPKTEAGAPATETPADPAPAAPTPAPAAAPKVEAPVPATEKPAAAPAKLAAAPAAAPEKPAAEKPAEKPAPKPAPAPAKTFPGAKLADRVLCKLESIPHKTSQTLGWAAMVTAVNAVAIWFVVLQRPPADQAPSVVAVASEKHEEAHGAAAGGGHGAEAKKDDGHGGGAKKDDGHGGGGGSAKKSEPKKKPEKKGGAKKKDEGGGGHR